jgi:hypothetical protein
MWTVFASRWKKFLFVGLIYLWCIVLARIAFVVWVQSTPLPLGYHTSLSVSPHMLVGLLGYILFQLWYVGMLYSVALKKEGVLLDRIQAGIEHLPALLGIKSLSAVLMGIVLMPVVVTAFLTSNILVFVVFGPLFIIAAIVLLFMLSLSIPAYFHGISWNQSLLRSLEMSSQHFFDLLKLWVCFFLSIVIFMSLLNQSPFVVVAAMLGIVSPLQVLFSIALYRRYALSPETFLPAEPQEVVHVEVVSVAPKTAVAKKPSAKSPTRRIRRTHKTIEGEA